MNSKEILSIAVILLATVPLLATTHLVGMCKSLMMECNVYDKPVVILCRCFGVDFASLLSVG